jgi:hypothetical protein
MIPQGYPIYVVDGDSVRMIVGWHQGEGGETYDPVTVDLATSGARAVLDTPEDLVIYPSLDDAIRAALNYQVNAETK